MTRDKISCSYFLILYKLRNVVSKAVFDCQDTTICLDDSYQEDNCKYGTMGRLKWEGYS